MKSWIIGFLFLQLAAGSLDFSIPALADQGRHPKGISSARMVARAAQTNNRTDSDEDEHPIDKWLAHAIDSDSTTAGMRHAYVVATDKWDQEMNRTWRKLMKRVSKEQRTILLKSQKAWLAFRDVERKAVVAMIIDHHGGTSYPVLADERWMLLVRARALDLLQYDHILDDF